jgi:pyruvate dehydrogenase E1 component alpha subunit
VVTDEQRGEPLGMYRTMVRIKTCDERIRTMLMSGRIAILYYSPRGQEAVAAGIGATLTKEDYLVTTYRSLHDCLAKGVSMRDLWAEYLGRATGTCKGKGGPMHITDPECGLMVTTGIVGSGLPIANGFGWSAQQRGDGRVAAVCFGDGATNIGAFHEALNLASIWDLPVVFVCQNNRYAEHSAFGLMQRTERVADRASAYRIPGVTVDGDDPVFVRDAMAEAVARARSGNGPTLVEALTFRYHGHLFGDDSSYMAPGELATRMAADPVPAYRARLLAEGTTEAELAAVEADALAEVDDAVEFALASPLPDKREVDRDVFATLEVA